MFIIMAIVVAAITATIMLRFKKKETSMVKVVAGAICVGLSVAVLNNYLVPMYPELSFLWMLIVFAFIGMLMYQWSKQGDSLVEFVFFTALTLIVGGTGCAAAVNYTPAKIIPLLIAVMVPIVAIGFYGVSAMRYLVQENTLNDRERAAVLKQHGKDKVDECDRKAQRFGNYMIIALIATVVVMFGAIGAVLGMSHNGIFDGAPDLAPVADAADATDSNKSDASKEKEKTASTSNWHFYNNDVQGGSSEDDFNFGPKPTAELAAEYDKDFRARLEKDPALGAADMAWADAWLGTRYLGEFYESCNKDWAKTINAAKEAWIKDPEAYKKTLDAFFKFLDTAEVKVVEANGLEDQMYMNPYTVDGTPDVIVLATPNHTGKFLTYVFTIKGTGKVKVMYRIECGYQPTNVEEVMGITPQTKPSSGKTTPGGKGDNPTPTPTPSKVNYKDQSQRKALPNDDKGPGEKTIGSDPNKSTKDTSDSSTSMSYDDYKKNVDNPKDTNKNQKTGSDSNKPSTSAPSTNTNVDNNGDKGNGGAPINTPTPTQEAQTVRNDPSAGQMSEPS